MDERRTEAEKKTAAISYKKHATKYHFTRRYVNETVRYRVLITSPRTNTVFVAVRNGSSRFETVRNVFVSRDKRFVYGVRGTVAWKPNAGHGFPRPFAARYARVRELQVPCPWRIRRRQPYVSALHRKRSLGDRCRSSFRFSGTNVVKVIYVTMVIIINVVLRCCFSGK